MSFWYNCWLLLENHVNTGTYYITASYPSDDSNNFDDSQLVPDGTQININEDIIIVPQGSFPELISTWTLLNNNANSSYINNCSQQTEFPFCIEP